MPRPRVAAALVVVAVLASAAVWFGVIRDGSGSGATGPVDCKDDRWAMVAYQDGGDPSPLSKDQALAKAVTLLEPRVDPRDLIEKPRRLGSSYAYEREGRVVATFGISPRRGGGWAPSGLYFCRQDFEQSGAMP